ncbi:MAG: LanC-like protein [Actinobacteria bacterium]|nr:LanC-like protein [Actinomycetota bacterium]
MLHRPEAFEPLTDAPWDSDDVRASIRGIVTDTDRALRGRRLLWRAHEWDSWQATSPVKNLYCGAAGVIWALDALGRRGHAESALDLGDLAIANLELSRKRPDYMRGIELPDPRESSLCFGETGILLVAWRLAPSTERADALLACLRGNVSNEADELMWGTPGTLLAARAMLDWTGEERWESAWRESAEALWSRRNPSGEWIQRLHGHETRYLGPAHGLTGNVLALLQGGALIDTARRDALENDTAKVLAGSAFVEDGLANWPPLERSELPAPDGQIRLQWCHGAPGIVTSAASYLDEELLLAGAELIWRAGPHGMEKGGGLCHGTAGNGYALLEAFDRTGDELWLERARRFAVHALEQVVRARTELGRGRYSLFTGDIGAALFAADCLDSRTAFPILDSFDW